MSSPIDKIKSFVFNLNERGIPLPLLRDPDKDGPSVALTMMVIAFGLAAIALIGKFTKYLGEVDTSGANYLFLTTAGLYLGRKISSDGKKTEVSETQKEEK